MNPLQKCNAHKSQQFGRLWSNRFGENRLTDACRAVFSKQAAPKYHAFLFCHEPLSPGTRCGEFRGGLSSRAPGAESLKHRSKSRRSRPAGSIGSCGGSYCRRASSVSGRVSAAQWQVRSTKFPLRRLAVRGCERTMEPHQRCGGVSGRFACKSNQQSRQPE